MNQKTILLLSITTFGLFVFLSLFQTNAVNGQSKYSPFYVNETTEAEKNRIDWIKYNNSEYGFSIDYLKGATIEDMLNVEEAAKTYRVEGPQITFHGGGPKNSDDTFRFTRFDIYLNDSINMERYIQRDLEGSPITQGTQYHTEVIDSGSPAIIAGLPGKIIKYEVLGGTLTKKAAYFNDNNNTYHIEYTDDPLLFNDEIFDHVVNSFKFIPIEKQIPSNDNSKNSDNDNGENEKLDINDDDNGDNNNKENHNDKNSDNDKKDGDNDNNG